jgi:enediyne biosynthesis protein E4
VVADDLDGDGKMDLLVTTIRSWPAVQRTVRVFKNVVEDSGNWIGFRLREERGGCSPVGARIAVYHPGGTAVRQIITGDSYRSRHANTVHFGLGGIAQVDKAEIRWPNGRVVIIDKPKVNQYHAVSCLAAEATQPRRP